MPVLYTVKIGKSVEILQKQDIFFIEKQKNTVNAVNIHIFYG
jgi:hypothetical protein